MMEKITLVFDDDHPLFRQVVVDTLSLSANMQILAQASSGNEGLALIRQDKPHVAIVDVNLPEMNGQQLTKQIIEDELATRIILLTAYDDVQQKTHGMRAGAAAFVQKISFLSVSNGLFSRLPGVAF